MRDDVRVFRCPREHLPARPCQSGHALSVEVDPIIQGLSFQIGSLDQPVPGVDDAESVVLGSRSSDPRAKPEAEELSFVPGGVLAFQWLTPDSGLAPCTHIAERA